MDRTNISDKTFIKEDPIAPDQNSNLMSASDKMREEANLIAKPSPINDKYKWDSEFLPNKIYGSSKWIKPEVDPIAWADKLQNKALSTLAEQHKDLVITTNDQNVRVFPFQAEYTVKKDSTATELAREQLGKNASKSQVDYYADLLLEVNEKTEKSKTFKFAANESIKMPGQTADGGLTVADAGSTKIEWQDGSLLVQKTNGDNHVGWGNGDDTTLINWNRKDADANNEKHIGATESRTESPDGSWVKEIRKDEGTAFAKTEETQIDSQGRQRTVFLAADSELPQKVTLAENGKPTLEFERNAAGDLLSKDGNSGITDMGIVYQINKQNDGGEERVHENGTTEKLDAKGNLLFREGHDQQNRLFNEFYHEGSSYPFKVAVTINPDEKPTNFVRTAAGRYVAPFAVDGKKVGEIELGKGIFDYANKAKQIDKILAFDGETLESFNLPYHKARTIETKNNNKVVTEYDHEGGKKSRIYTRGNDFSISRYYNSSGDVDTINIESKLGNGKLKNDREVGKFLGEGISKDGQTEGIYVSHSRLVYPSGKGDAAHSEVLVLPQSLGDLAKPIVGDYNEDLRTVTTIQHGHKQIDSVDSGRKDIINSDGSITGTTRNGEKSSIKANGEVMVEHSDSAVRLNTDNTIDRWGQTAKESAKHEALSKNELAFLEKNRASIELRDLAEIHRRFNGDNTKLDGLYQAISKVDDIPNFSPSEKQVLVQNIMHHIANPADIYQGAIGTCNVTVIQRELAMAEPERYVKLLVDAASNQMVDPTTGQKVELNPENLKLHDLSERDLASRIFQSMALNVLYSPGKYLNTPDTTGQLFDRSGNLMAFNGLNMAQITELTYRLSGTEHAQVLLKTPEDIAKAFEKNGRRPMTIAVDAMKPPFVAVATGATGGHVVTITGVEKVGENYKVALQNQWGLADDHSTPETEVDAAVLVENMKDEPAAIILGAQGKVFKIEDGKYVVDEDATREARAVLEKSMS